MEKEKDWGEAGETVRARHRAVGSLSRCNLGDVGSHITRQERNLKFG